MKDDTFIVYIEKIAEKRLVPWSHLRPLHAAASSPLSRDFFPVHNNRICDGIGQSYMYRCDYNLHGNTKSYTKRQRIGNFTTGFSYNRDAICNSDFDFEPYINLSNFSLNASHAQRELIAYPMVYSQSGNMNSNNSNSNPSNGGNSTGNSKSMKNRQSNNAQHQPNDVESKVTVLKNDTDNGNGNGNGNGGGGQQYGKNGHEMKNDSQSSNTSSSSNAGHQQSYHQQQQQQMAEPNVTVDTSSGMPTTVSHPPMAANYYQQGPLATAPAPVYYYPTAADDQNGIYGSSDMVVPHGVYAIPAAAAYQSTAATTAMPPTMQPGMYAPATQTTHYPIPVNGWPAYTQPINPQGNA